MDDSCAVCAESLEWVAYGSCGHRDVCSTCVARLRFICDDRRCCICKTESDIIFVTKALGDYTRTISDFSVFPRDATEGRNGSYWFHEDTGAYFDDSDHYKMIKAMCRLSCSVCDKEDQAGANDGPKRRGKFRNVEQLKSHLYHRHRLFMCSLCLEGRKIFICEQKLYTRSQLNRHTNTGDSEVDGNESERGGFMGHPVCEFCKKPFYGDNELYSHMSTEHYTCHICQRQNPGQYEYYKDYNDLEIHFRQQHFLCEDEACLAKKFVVFLSESEMKRHNAIEHGGHMSRSKRNAVLQIPTSFRYRRGSEQDHRRGRRRGLQFVSSDAQLASAIDASLETANASQSAPDHIETSVVDEIVAPFETLATADTEGSSRYRQALSGGARNVQLQESSFPPLPMVPTSSQQKPKYDSDGLSQNTMAARLRGRKNGTVNVLNSAHAWPSTSQGASSSSSSFPWSKPTTNGLVSTSNSVISSQTRPATSSGSTFSSYASTAQTRTVRDNVFISGNTSSHQRNLSATNRVSHSASAPNLIERGSSDSSSSDFPPISARKESSVPTPGQGLSVVEDVHTANKSLVETIRSALEFDEDKYTAFKDISAEYRQGMINAAEYLSYVEQFGLSHLVIELARLCPDAQKQRELIETYNMSLKFRSGGENDSSNIMIHKKANKASKKGKGKVVETTDGKSKDALTDNVMNTVRKLQASYRPSEEEVEVLSKDGYRASKGKLKISVEEQQELSSANGGGLGESTRRSDSQATGISSNQNPGGSSGGKQRKKTSKFHRVRLGNGSAATLLDFRQSDPDLEHEEDSAIEKQNPSKSFPIRGAWRHGGGQKLVAMTQRDTAK